MVQVEQQQVLARVPAVQHGAQQRALFQVEGLPRVRVQPAPRLRLPAVMDVDDGQPDVQRGGDLLKHPALLFDEGGAQRLVTVHQLLEGAAKGVHVQRAGQAHGGGDVEGGASRLHPLLEPHALLREGHGRPSGVTGLVAQQLGEPCALLLRGERHCSTPNPEVSASR